MFSNVTSARIFGTGSLILAVVLLFAVNIFSHQTLQSRRIDLTENKLYTLSQGTRSILSKLDEPITLRYYLSRDLATSLPPLKSYADRVREVLGEYERGSGGSLSVVEIDPKPFSEEEDRAVAYGLRGVPLDAGGSVLYIGLVGANSTGKEEVIPYLALDRESFLEYDLTKLVHNLSSNAKQHTVGVLSTLPMSGMGPQAALRGVTAPPWVVMEQIQQLFNVVDIDPQSDSIPEQTDVLLLVHPKGLSDGMLYAIDQFVLGGGHALVFLDPNADAEQPQMAGNMPIPGDRNSRLEKLMPSWGLELEDGIVAADLNLAATVRMERQGRAVTFEYPVWLNTLPELLDQDDVITAQLGSVAFGTAGSLKTVEGAGTTVTPLVRTTDQAMRMPASMVALGADPQSLLDDYKPGSEALTLAARVQGKAKSAFPDGKPAAPKTEDGESAAETETAAEEDSAEHKAQGDINIIVVADADMLTDRYWVRVQDFLGSRIASPIAANGPFAINALDNLTGSSDLISVRNRGNLQRPFTRIEAMRREAEKRFREKEQELSQRLEETERKLLELEEAKGGQDALVMSKAQADEIVNFRDQRVQIRKELREVRRQLREDIEVLESKLKFANTAVVPIAIGVIGLIAGLWQMRRRQAHVTAA